VPEQKQINMNSTTKKPNVAFWIIAIIAVLWNLMGVMQFFMQAMNTESFRAQYTSEQLAVVDALPLYYIVIFAVAVIASAIGAILLILRKKLAIPFFTAGLVAVLAQTVYNLFINEGKSAYGVFEYTMLIMIPLASFLLWWYAKHCNKQGWLS